MRKEATFIMDSSVMHLSIAMVIPSGVRITFGSFEPEEAEDEDEDEEDGVEEDDSSPITFTPRDDEAERREAEGGGGKAPTP